MEWVKQVEMTPTLWTAIWDTASAPASTTLSTGQDMSSRYRSMRQEMVLQATSRAFTPRSSMNRSMYRVMVRISSAVWLP